MKIYQPQDYKGNRLLSIKDLEAQNKAIQEKLDVKADKTELSAHTEDMSLHLTPEEKEKLDEGYSAEQIDEKLALKADDSALKEHTENEVIHVTQADKDKWNNTYSKEEVDGKVNVKADQSSLEEHTSDTVIHVEQKDKDKWNDTYSQSEVDEKVNLKANQSDFELLTGRVETLEAIEVDETYKPDSSNAQAGTAVAEAIKPLATKEELNALDAKKVDLTAFTEHKNDSTVHITSDERNKWNAKVTTEQLDAAKQELKSDIDSKVESMLHWKGNVATVADLESKKAEVKVGDVWNVQENDANYAWNGSDWDKLSEDISGLAPKTLVTEHTSNLEIHVTAQDKLDWADKYKKSEVDSKLGEKAELSEFTSLKGEFDTHKDDTTLHTSEVEKQGWNDKYTKSEIDKKVETIEAELGTKTDKDTTDQLTTRVDALEAIEVDKTYKPDSANAQAGIAVAEAVTQVLQEKIATKTPDNLKEIVLTEEAGSEIIDDKFANATIGGATYDFKGHLHTIKLKCSDTESGDEELYLSLWQAEASTTGYILVAKSINKIKPIAGTDMVFYFNFEKINENSNLKLIPFKEGQQPTKDDKLVNIPCKSADRKSQDQVSWLDKAVGPIALLDVNKRIPQATFTILTDNVSSILQNSYIVDELRKETNLHNHINDKEVHLTSEKIAKWDEIETIKSDVEELKETALTEDSTFDVTPVVDLTWGNNLLSTCNYFQVHARYVKPGKIKTVSIKGKGNNSQDTQAYLTLFTSADGETWKKLATSSNTAAVSEADMGVYNFEEVELESDLHVRFVFTAENTGDISPEGDGKTLIAVGGQSRASDDAISQATGAGISNTYLCHFAISYATVKTESVKEHIGDLFKHLSSKEKSYLLSFLTGYDGTTTVKEIMDKLAQEATEADLEELRKEVQKKADQTEISRLDGQLMNKASQSDVEDLRSQLQNKAEQTEVTELSGKLEEKADKSEITDLTEKLNDKADKSTVDTLTNQVQDKAEQSAVDSLTQQLSDKADKSDVESLTTQVEGKADSTTVEEIKEKVDKIPEDLTQQLEDKVEQSEFESLSQRVSSIESKPEIQVDKEYQPQSENPQAGTAVAQAITPLATKEEVGRKVDSVITGPNGTALIQNEGDGGLLKFTSTDYSTTSGVTVNDGTQNIYAQLYAKKPTESKAVRLNVNLDGIYYTKGKTSPGDQSETDEITTKADLNKKADLSKVVTLESSVLALQAAQVTVDQTYVESTSEQSKNAQSGIAVKGAIDKATSTLASQQSVTELSNTVTTHKSEVDTALKSKADQSALTSHIDDTNKHVSDSERTQWNAKVDQAALDAAKQELQKEIANKVESMFHYKGSVETEDELEQKKEEAQIGDVWNVNETDANYVYDGGDWDKLSEDISGFAKSTELQQHISDTEKHVSTEEKEKWNAKADAQSVSELTQRVQTLENEPDPTVDQVYNGESENAQSGKAVKGVVDTLATKTEVEEQKTKLETHTSNNQIHLTKEEKEKLPNMVTSLEVKKVKIYLNPDEAPKLKDREEGVLYFIAQSKS